MRKRNIIILLSAGIIGWLSLSQADTHDHAKALQEQGDILPLEQILEQARQSHPGRVLETELERKRGSYVYEVEILDDSGEVWEMEFDAASGELLKQEQED